MDEDKVKRTNVLDKIKKRTDQWTGKLFVDFVRSGSSVEMKNKDGLLSSVIKSKNIVFHFPRALDGLNPYFSFGQLNNKDAVMPVSVILNGDHIDVSFEKQSSFAGTVKPLFISSADGVFYMDVSFDENGEVKDISEMKF